MDNNICPVFNPYPPIHIEVQFISARTLFCTGGNELNEQYAQAEMNYMNRKLNSHHFTFLKFQNPSSGSEVTVNSKYYYP